MNTDAATFLNCLDPAATFFTFQTFDDNEGPKDRTLVRILHGPLEQHAAELADLNAKGAGIFVTVNETNGKGRKAKDVIRVRAVFVDLDGAPLEPAMANGMPPHIVNETSRGRWHVYWRIKDVELDDFSEIQKALIEYFGSDPAVCDLPRVMRLPGFVHRKGEPFLVRIKSTHERPAYAAADFQSFRPNTDKSQGRRAADEPPSKWQILNAEALTKLDAWVPKLFPGAVKNSAGVYRVASKMLRRDLAEDLSISPQGIKDFGVHDLGDAREGKRSPLDLVMEHRAAKNLEAAFEWLSEQLEDDAGDAAASGEEAPQPRSKDVITVRASDVVMRAKQWIWKGHLLRGCAGVVVRHTRPREVAGSLSLCGLRECRAGLARWHSCHHPQQCPDDHGRRHLRPGGGAQADRGQGRPLSRPHPEVRAR